MPGRHVFPGVNRSTDRGTGGSSNPGPPIPLGDFIQESHSPEPGSKSVGFAQGEASTSKAQSADPHSALHQTVSSSRPRDCTGCPVHYKENSEAKLAMSPAGFQAAVHSLNKKPDEVTHRDADAAAELAILQNFAATDKGIFGGASSLIRGG